MRSFYGKTTLNKRNRISKNIGILCKARDYYYHYTMPMFTHT